MTQRDLKNPITPDYFQIKIKFHVQAKTKRTVDVS